MTTDRPTGSGSSPEIPDHHDLDERRSEIYGSSKPEHRTLFGKPDKRQRTLTDRQRGQKSEHVEVVEALEPEVRGS